MIINPFDPKVLLGPSNTNDVFKTLDLYLRTVRFSASASIVTSNVTSPDEKYGEEVGE